MRRLWTRPEPRRPAGADDSRAQLSKYGGTSMMDAMQDVRTGQKSTAEVLDKSVRTNENLVRLEPGGYFINTMINLDPNPPGYPAS